MKRMIDAILAGYGSPVTILYADGARKQTRAFVQPVTEKGWQGIQKTMLPLGQSPVGRFVYIGPAEQKLKEEDAVVYDGKTFEVRRAETLEVAGQALYIWGLLTIRGGDDPWS